MLKHHCTEFTDRLQKDMRELMRDIAGIWLHLHDFSSVEEAKLRLQQDLQQLRRSLDELEQVALAPVPPENPENPEQKRIIIWICRGDESNENLTPIGGYTFLIAQNKQEEGICLVWDGWKKSTITSQILRQIEKEADEAGERLLGQDKHRACATRVIRADVSFQQLGLGRRTFAHGDNGLNRRGPDTLRLEPE